jgi:peptidoglycan/xylan/chitin deacetylase (PgdA/CDA1 family)
MKPPGIPVVMYHGVGPIKTGWPWNYLIIPTDIFDAQMRALKEHGWTTITLVELFNHLANGDPLPAKPVVLTFDDGYLDNYVFAYPILKKYGHHAVVFVSTDFADPNGTVRPTLADVWEGKKREGDLPVKGFLSWDEMRIMAESGVFEIQSHAQSHTWYYSGPTIIDFHRPDGVDGYITHYWLGWNRLPERKHAYMTERLEEEVPYGTPVYEYGKSLSVRRYFEDPALTERLVRHVADNGGTLFFDRPGWRRELEAVAEAHPPSGDRIETEEEYRLRVASELAESRRIITEHLGTPPDFLCWPGGGRNPDVLGLADEAGYRATTTHFQDRARKNLHGQDPREINRTGCGSPWIWRGMVIRRTDPAHFLAILDDFNGKRGAIWKMRFFKMKYIVRRLLAGRRDDESVPPPPRTVLR